MEKIGNENKKYQRIRKASSKSSRYKRNENIK